MAFIFRNGRHINQNCALTFGSKITIDIGWRFADTFVHSSSYCWSNATESDLHFAHIRDKTQKMWVVMGRMGKYHLIVFFLQFAIGADRLHGLYTTCRSCVHFDLPFFTRIRWKKKPSQSTWTISGSQTAGWQKRRITKTQPIHSTTSLRIAA